jgi:hypothetical protein
VVLSIMKFPVARQKQAEMPEAIISKKTAVP